MPLGSNVGERDRARRLWDLGQPPLPATAQPYMRWWSAPAYYEAAVPVTSSARARFLWDLDQPPLPATAANFERAWTVPAYLIVVTGGGITPVNTKAKVSGSFVLTTTKARVSGTWVTPIAVKARVSGAWVTI